MPPLSSDELDESLKAQIAARAASRPKPGLDQAKWDRYLARIKAVYTAKKPELLTLYEYIYAYYAESATWRRARVTATPEFFDEIERIRAAERGEGGVAKGRGTY